MNRREKMIKIKELIHEFKCITGLTIPFALLGIDILKFDTMVGGDENKSLKENIENKYGKRAVEIVEELIDYDLL